MLKNYRFFELRTRTEAELSQKLADKTLALNAQGLVVVAVQRSEYWNWLGRKRYKATLLCKVKTVPHE